MSLSVFVGNVGCGKSTLAKKLARVQNAVVVNMDTIQQMVSGGEYGAYDSDKKEVYQSIEDTAIESALKAGLDVIVDRTNMDAKRRQRFIDIGKKYAKEIICYNWGSGNRKDLNRRIKNPRGISSSQWEQVWEFMNKSYEEPTLEEGFDGVIEPPKKYKFHAVDFDGTIVENKFPEIGEIIDGTVDKLNEIYKDVSNIITIWTCRTGDYEAEMKKFLIEKKIPFDFINENPIFDTGSRKIFAHEYYDDRNKK